MTRWWYVLLALATSACGAKFTPQAATPPEALSTSSVAELQDVQDKAFTIVQSKCVTCHNATTASGGLKNMTDVMHLIAQGVVVPGDEVNSVFYRSIERNLMPKQGPALSAEEKVTIKNCIVADLKDVAVTAVSYQPTWAIIQAKCLSCHSLAGGYQGGINLESLAKVKELVNGTDPAKSALFDTSLKGRMPPAPAAKLNTRELAQIYNWRLGGATQDGAD